MSLSKSTYHSSKTIENFLFSSEKTISKKACYDFLYEKENHLGNVRAVVSDLKESTLNGTTGAPEDFEPVVATISNYYPFGMLQAGRNFNSGDYEYGFNGKRMDSEVSGTGNSYDYGFRIYNPRIGKFLSVDPLARKFSFYSPYHFAGNKPISALDIDGLEDIYFMDSFINDGGNGEESFDILTSTEIGNEIITSFKNIDPDVGEVNKGYDIFVQSVKLTVSDGTGVLSGRNSAIITTEKNTVNPLFNGELVTVIEAILIARTVPEDNIVRQDLIATYGEEFVINSSEENLKSSLKNDRGIIIIQINTNQTLEAKTSTLGHEIGAHADNTAKGVKKTQAEEHFDFEGTKSDNTVTKPDSKGGKLRKQINQEVKSRKETKKNGG